MKNAKYFPNYLLREWYATSWMPKLSPSEANRRLVSACSRLIASSYWLTSQLLGPRRSRVGHQQRSPKRRFRYLEKNTTTIKYSPVIKKKNLWFLQNVRTVKSASASKKSLSIQKLNLRQFRSVHH